MDFPQLFKLRLVVADIGESQRLGWWNSGLLTGRGELPFQQGLPRATAMAGGGSLHLQEESVGGERKPLMNEPNGCGLSAGLACG